MAGIDRELILGRIRAAAADVPMQERPAWSPDGDPETAYRRRHALSPEASPDALAALFVARCRDYAATVTVCAPDEIAATVGEILARHRAHEIAAPSALDASWRPGRRTYLEDAPPLSLEQLDGVDGTLTGCELAIAETGTIVLASGPSQGRRALTLVPDLHVCVVLSEQIVGSVPEAVAGLAGAFDDGAPVTFISGPSATSDIELSRVEGVHGPRKLEVVVAVRSIPPLPPP